MSAALRLPLLLLVAAVRPGLSLNCLQEGDPGETSPREVNVQPSHKFRITCSIDPAHPRAAGLTSADLYFTRDFTARNKESRSDPVPASQSQTINSTTLVIEDRLETAVHYTYTCRKRGRRTRHQRDSALCSSSVNVGHPPLDVKNFSCIVKNWSNITCKWKLQYNAIKSQYRLQYLLQPSYGARDWPPREQWVLCPRYDHALPGYRTSCTITEKTQPVYRTGALFYNFTMNITNALGTRLQWLGLVNNFAVVLPAAPESVKSSQITANSVLLETTIGWPMDSFPRPLDFEVTYTSPWDQQPQTVNASSMSGTPSDQDPSEPLPLLITGLRPYTEYRFSVRMKSSLAEREELWSEPTRLEVRTLPLVPAAAPEVDQGSFQLLGSSAGSRTVLIYWRQIAAWQRNGAEFRYCVSARDETGRPLTPSTATEAYARFTGVTERATTFRVASCNAVGRSAQTSSLTVPDQRQVGKPPHAVSLRISGPGQYQLNWQHSGLSRPPTGFTLFSCEHRPDRPYQCQGRLEMWHVSGTARQHNLSLPVGPEYQFAVSANFRADNGTGAPATSSGMVWSRCSVPFSRDGDQAIRGLSVQVADERSVTLAWSEDCAIQVTALARVMVIYCELIGSECQGEETSREVNRTGPSSLTLRDLRPYTKYRISVALITEGGKRGPRSLPQTAQTLQARPQSPTAAKVSAVTNTSLTVTWGPPSWPNGPLHHYLVLVTARDSLVTGREPLRVPSDTNSVTVTGLRPFTGYSVTVRACTVTWRTLGCSQDSRVVTAQTLIGAPGGLEPPRPRLLNTSSVLLRWRPPRQAGGPRLIYRLRTVSEVAGVNYTQTDTEVTGDRLEVAQQLARACQPGAEQRHLFWVRAGAVLPSGGPLLGPWSEPAEQGCVLTAAWPLAAVLGLVAGALLLAALAVLAVCLCSRTKQKWVKMRDIGVNLPSGLERPEKGLAGLRGSERRPGYGRLVSHSAEGAAATSGRPLLLEDPAPVEPPVPRGPLSGAADSEPPLSAAADCSSCSSSATNYTDSGAESEKVGSPTYERLPWPPSTPQLAPYVQAGGPGTPPAGGPIYSEFSPYVDAKAIRTLLTRGVVDALPTEAAPGDLTRSEPDLSGSVVMTAGKKGSSLPYGQLGLRSSAGYVSMGSDDAIKPTSAEKKPEKPYVGLGPSIPVLSTDGFPPYVLAGLAAEDCDPYSVQPREPSPKPNPPPNSPPNMTYVSRGKLQPAAMELQDLPMMDLQADRASATPEPVLSPKKLATVATTREPYCRVVTQHQGTADLGPSVSMV